MSSRLTAKLLAKTPLYEGFLKVYRCEVDVQRHDGGSQRQRWELMERGHSVAVLGYDPKRDEVVLITEFRPGMLLAGEYPFTPNLVAGGINTDESVTAAAVREMKEETGLELADPVVVHPGAFVSSGGTSEKIAIVAGRIDAARAGGVHGHADEREDILTLVLPATEFIRRVRAGEISDLKTIVAGYWLDEHRSELRGKQ
jgi:ADP-ribose pyrophosphatase